MLEELRTSDAQLVLFGEEHGNPIAHGLEQLIYDTLTAEPQGEPTTGGSAATATAAAPARPCALSMEMLTTCRQSAVDAFLRGGMSTSELFEAGAGGWSNYADYANLVERARSTGNLIVGANAHRRFTSAVARKGPAALEGPEFSAEDLQLIAPLPLPEPSPQLVDKIGFVFEGMGKTDPGKPRRMLAAQTLWDATMAHSILRTLAAMRNLPPPQQPPFPPPRVFHVCGRYHCEHFLGIAEHFAPRGELAGLTQDQIQIVVFNSVDLQAHGGCWDTLLEKHGDAIAGAGDFVALLDASALPPRSS